MLQSTAGLWAQGKVDEITRLVSRLMRYVAVTTAFLLIYVLVFSEHIVTFYFGPQFRDATLPLQLLVPGAFAFSLARVIRPVIQAHGWVMTLLKTVSAATVINIALNVALVPRWGAAGASGRRPCPSSAWRCCMCGSCNEKELIPFRVSPQDVSFCYARVQPRFDAHCPDDFLAAPGHNAGGLTAVGFYWCGVFWLGLIRVRELEQIVESMPGPLRQAGTKAMRLLQPMLVRLDSIAIR